MRKPLTTLPSTRTIRIKRKMSCNRSRNASQRNRRAESTTDRGTGGFEEAAGHPLLGTESHTRHRGKQRAAQEAAIKEVLQDKTDEKKHKEPPRHRRNTDNRIWNFNRHLPFSIRECQVLFLFFKEG